MQQLSQRLNIYAGIHKGLRAMMGQALVNTGKTDWQDAVDREATLAELRDLCTFCRAHLDHENTFLHAAMEVRAPGSAHRIADEHVEHQVEIGALEQMIDSLARGLPATRADLGEALYRRLACFIGENFAHMEYEEAEHNAVLWSVYTDAELADIHHALVSSLSPQETMQCLRWILLYSSHDERVGALSEMRANAPAPVFDAVMAMLRPQLGERDRAKLDAALDYAMTLRAA